MTYKELKLKIKNEQKERAAAIRILKSVRKPDIYLSNPSFYDELGDLERLQYDFRHYHISYCTLLNNTKYSDVERECRDDPSPHYLDSIKKEWEGVLDKCLDYTS